MKSAPIDLRLRGAMNAECRALLAAYEESTGRHAMVDYVRVSYLYNLALRDVRPDDIYTVVRYVRRLIRGGANKRKVGTFTPASLEFVNLLGDTARFLDRLQTAREELVNNRAVKGKLVPVVRPVSEKDTVTRLEPAKELAPAPIRELLAETLRRMAGEIEA